MKSPDAASAATTKATTATNNRHENRYLRGRPSGALSYLCHQVDLKVNDR